MIDNEHCRFKETCSIKTGCDRCKLFRGIDTSPKVDENDDVSAADDLLNAILDGGY
jgi:hypothetical protein